MDRNVNCMEAWKGGNVALRKESVDRNAADSIIFDILDVALRKESVDRNCGPYCDTVPTLIIVALRKESVDRNMEMKDYD